MTRVMTDGPEASPYLAAGTPSHCFLPSCRKLFAHTCVHGLDGRYYCSQECVDTARSVDFRSIEYLPQRRF
jgi:hypothetical protein